MTADPRCVAAARKLVEERCAVHPLADVDAARLLVSEIVTNVIRHTPTGEGELRLLLGEQTLRVEVEDRGPGIPSSPLPPDPELGGRFGLNLVERLADAWGVRNGNCIWFELPLRQAQVAEPTERSSARRRYKRGWGRPARPGRFTRSAAPARG